MAPEASRDVHLLEIDLQNRATWQLIEAATKQRDAAIRYHGALLVLLSALLPHLTVGQLLAVGVCGTAFLVFASGTTFVATQAFRVQQFQVGVAERFSRNCLAGDEGTWFSDLAEVRRIRPLGEQGDPMGFAVLTSQLLLLVDVFALSGLWVVTVLWAMDLIANDRLVLVLAAAAVVGFIGVLVVRWATRRLVRESEEQANGVILARLHRLGR